MKRVATAAIAGVVVMLASMIGFAPAQAASCSAPEGDSGDPLIVKLCITPKEQTVYERTSFSVVATASSNHPDFECDSLTYTYRGKTNTSGHFTAPSVSHDIDTQVVAKCTFDDAVALGGGGTGRLGTVASAIVTQPATATVHVLNLKNGKGDKDDDDHHKKKNKDDDDDNGNLPNTGGERLAWLVIGLLLVAAGTTVVVSSRKRDSVA